MGGVVVWVPKFPDREMWRWAIGRLGSFAGLRGSGEKSWIESPVSIIELATLYIHNRGGAITATGCSCTRKLCQYGGPFCTDYSTLAAGRNLGTV